MLEVFELLTNLSNILYYEMSFQTLCLSLKNEGSFLHDRTRLLTFAVEKEMKRTHEHFSRNERKYESNER